MACGGSGGSEANGGTLLDPDGGDTGARVVFTTDEGEVSTGPVAVADSPEERSRGLMGITSMPADEGMVFVYEEPSDLGFWMKDTRIPLAVAFWGEDQVVAQIIEMTPCEADPCPVYQPDQPYIAALEMNTGWFAARGIGVGDRAELRRER